MPVGCAWAGSIATTAPDEEPGALAGRVGLLGEHPDLPVVTWADNSADVPHITAIMKRLDVSSRFAAGAAAQRRGWIG